MTISNNNRNTKTLYHAVLIQPTTQSGQFLTWDRIVFRARTPHLAKARAEKVFGVKSHFHVAVLTEPADQWWRDERLTHHDSRTFRYSAGTWRRGENYAPDALPGSGPVALIGFEQLAVDDNEAPASASGNERSEAQ